MLSTIFTGHDDLADVLWLVAVICGLLAAFASSPKPTVVPASVGPMLLALAVTLTACALLVL